jgi:hypothetical protein
MTHFKASDDDDFNEIRNRGHYGLPKKVPQRAVNLDTELTGGAKHDDKLFFAPVNVDPGGFVIPAGPSSHFKSSAHT